MTAALASNAGTAFFTGILTSVGPCIAPRYVALTARATRTRSGPELCAFVVGSVVGYAIVAGIGGMLSLVQAYSRVLYAALACAMLIAGFRSLLARPDTECCDATPAIRSLGGAFVVGCSLSLAISPCCTPAIVALGAWVGTSGDLGAAMVALCAFAAGHALIPIALAMGLRELCHSVGSGEIRHAIETVGAGLGIALGLFYAVLA